MKIVILNGSPRRQGVVSQMLDIIGRELGTEATVTTIQVCGLDVRPCTGCMQCRGARKCILPDDDAQRTLAAIEEADAIVVGSPCYWGNINGQLKVLFDRMVYGLMGETGEGLPISLHKGKCAAIVASSTTPFPFNILFKQTRGVVSALREILKWSGFKVIGTVEKGGTKKHPELTEREKGKCRKIARRIIRNCQEMQKKHGESN